MILQSPNPTSQEVSAQGDRAEAAPSLTIRGRSQVVDGNGVAKKRPEYAAWYAAIWRCTNPVAKNYPNYGGRGITICQRWRESFDAFLADVGPRPGPQYSLDRIDNDGNYEPGNVRWATRVQQRNNCRPSLGWPSRRLTVRGVTRSVAEWSRLSGLPYTTIRTRVLAGWDAERAVTTPPDPRKTRKQGRVS